MTNINTLLDEFADCNFQCGAMNVDDTVNYREMVDRSVEIRKAIIAFYSEQSGWISVATEMFYKYRAIAEDGGISELTLINAGKAVALSTLLEKFGSKPPIPPPPPAEPEHLDIPMFLRRQAD